METLELMTPEEAARLLKVCRVTIYRYIAEGLLEAQRLPKGIIRIKREDLEALLQPTHRKGTEGMSCLDTPKPTQEATGDDNRK